MRHWRNNKHEDWEPQKRCRDWVIYVGHGVLLRLCSLVSAAATTRNACYIDEERKILVRRTENVSQEVRSALVQDERVQHPVEQVKGSITAVN